MIPWNIKVALLDCIGIIMSVTVPYERLLRT